MPLSTPTTRSEQDGRIFLVQGAENVSPTLAGAYSSAFKVEQLDEATFYLKNTSDRAVTLQAEAAKPSDPTFTDPYPIGSAIALSAGNVTATRDVAVLTDHHGFVRWKVTATGSDATTGTLSIDARGRYEV